MPRPKPNPNSRRRVPATPPQNQVVEPLWILKGIALTILVALLCGYLTLCLLFYQGQWQLVLHPTRTTAAPASIAGSAYDLIHFGPDDSATPQLTGWWIPAEPNAPYASDTILFLPGADGSLADSLPTLGTLHTLGINVFAIDYRGYGQSAPMHPSQQTMIHDADSAWQYLTTSRAIPTQRIVLYGNGVGASLATRLALAHPSLPALILDSPHTDLLEAAQRDARSRFIPVKLLFHEDFPLAKPLSALATPKLLLSRSPASIASFQSAAGPKTLAELIAADPLLYNQTLARFFAANLAPQRHPTAPLHGNASTTTSLTR